MSPDLNQRIMSILSTVKDPDNDTDIVSNGMVSSLQISDDHQVILLLTVDPARGTALESMRHNIEQQIASLPRVKKATVILTAEHKPAPAKPKAPDPHGMQKNPPIDMPARYILAVASGKGGVGKSTVAANTAITLAQQGHRVGLLDADIYGPSQPMMMGNESYKPDLNDQKRIIPLNVHGIAMMSIGFMVDKEKALIWRGPMAQSAFYQLLRDVQWVDDNTNPLDYLIIDMPPGTGDIQLTMAQKIKVSGALIVSTPQDIALIDARRAVAMFQKTDIPVVGIVENMSMHICSNCGHEEHIFGHGGAEQEAQKLNVPFLGGIPLSRNIREQSDKGIPIMLHETDSTIAKTYGNITAALK